MPTCDQCGNDYDKAFQLTKEGRTWTFDSFECAIQAVAPTCPHCSVRIVGHGGTTNGFQARLALVPERRLAFAILTNSNLGAAACREVGDALLERLAGLRREEPARVSLPADRLARFSGRYERPGFAVTLAADGDELVVQNDGENVFTKEREPVPPRRAAPVGEARFLVLDGESAGSTFDFVRNEDGAVRFLRFGGRLLERS